MPIVQSLVKYYLNLKYTNTSPDAKKINDDLNALYGTVTPANLDVSQISRNSVQPTASRQLMQICMRNI